MDGGVKWRCCDHSVGLAILHTGIASLNLLEGVWFTVIASVHCNTVRRSSTGLLLCVSLSLSTALHDGLVSQQRSSPPVRAAPQQGPGSIGSRMPGPCREPPPMPSQKEANYNGFDTTDVMTSLRFRDRCDTQGGTRISARAKISQMGTLTTSWWVRVWLGQARRKWLKPDFCRAAGSVAPINLELISHHSPQIYQETSSSIHPNPNMYEKNRKQEASLILLKSLSNSPSSSSLFPQQQAGDDPFQPLPLKRMSTKQDTLLTLHSQDSIHSICKDLLNEETQAIDRLLVGMNQSTTTTTATATNNNNNNNNNNTSMEASTTSSLDLLDSSFLDGLVRSCDDLHFDTPELPPPVPAHVGSSSSDGCVPRTVPPSSSPVAPDPPQKEDRPHLRLFQLSSIGTIEDPELLLEQEGNGPKTEEVRSDPQKIHHCRNVYLGCCSFFAA